MGSRSVGRNAGLGAVGLRGPGAPLESTTSATLPVGSTLDRTDVPEYVFDHVMHHELLHKKHGIQWRGRRQHAHTSAFREEERRFEQYEEAAAFLNKLSAATG